MRITVASYKGGVGKTTTAVHLATSLQETGKTLLIDGDPNHSVISWAKRGELPFDVVDVFKITKNQVNEYEHVVVDTKARPDSEDLESLIHNSDLLVLPTTPDILALDALNNTLHSFKNNGAANKYKVLLTVVPPRPSRDGDEARAALTEAGIPVFERVIRRYAAYQKAVLKGVPVHKVNDPNARIAWSDYQAVMKELLV